jgi:hypothetical protein
VCGQHRRRGYREAAGVERDAKARRRVHAAGVVLCDGRAAFAVDAHRRLSIAIGAPVDSSVQPAVEARAVHLSVVINVVVVRVVVVNVVIVDV